MGIKWSVPIADVKHIYLLPAPFQIMGRFTFLTLNLTARLIQKIYANIVKFKLLLKNNLYW